jgi:hypothetical protein
MGIGPPLALSTCMSAILAVAVGLLAVAGTSSPTSRPRIAHQAPAANVHATQVKAFTDRVEEYLALQRKVAATLPKLDETSDPKKISAREKALGEAIAKARPTARRGEVFGKELRPFFVKLIRSDWSKRTPADRRELMEEVPEGFRVGVNQPYPTRLPLVTFPPNILQELPRLPEDVEYRLLGRDLILRDVKANLIIDVLTNVLPA